MVNQQKQRVSESLADPLGLVTFEVRSLVLPKREPVPGQGQAGP